MKCKVNRTSWHKYLYEMHIDQRFLSCGLQPLGFREGTEGGLRKNLVDQHYFCSSLLVDTFFKIC